MANIPGIGQTLTTELRNQTPAKSNEAISAKSKAPETSPKPAEESPVTFSDASRVTQNIQREMASFPDVNADRVEKIRSQIEAGTYHIDSTQVASKLIMLEALIGGTDVDSN